MTGGAFGPRLRSPYEQKKVRHMPLPEERPLEESVYDSPHQASRMASFDPETVQPASTSPAPSSTAPGIGGTQGADGEQTGADQEPGPQAEELPKFDQRFTEEFNGLLFVGALTDTFTWLGHEFVIRTLTTGELAEVALAVKKYGDTDAALKVWQAAVVAACVMTVDGRPMPLPLTNDPNDTEFLNRFRFVMRSWFPPTLDAVYQRYYNLELTVRRVIEAMGNHSG